MIRQYKCINSVRIHRRKWPSGTRGMEFERDSALKEWAKDQPFTILALNPADRAVLRIADERDAIQKKTFTKWVNKHLKKVRRFVNDLFEDLRDGHNLISLLEVLTGDNLPREKGIMRFHMLQNIETALHFLHCKKIKLVNIRSEDIVDGNPKLTLGLIWTIILHFQISDVVGHESDMSAREVLLKWSQRTASKYPSVHISDFTSSWRDGLAFSALVHRNRPDLIDWRAVKNQMTVRERLEYVFHVIEKEYGVTRLLDPEDVDTPEPDEKSIITYVSSIYDVFPEPPSIHPLYDTKLQQRYYEYREIAHNLSLWMHEKMSVMQDYTFPNNLVEMRKVESESARFRNEEVPPKQRDKQRLHHLYKDVERYFETAGSAIDLEPELQVQNVEKLWNKLIICHEEREKSLIEETKRLEKLQRLAEKVNREIKYTESRLENLDKRVEDDGRRVDRLHPLEAKQASDILEQDIVSCEKIIQNLFSDVQILKDGRYTQSIELQKRVQQLHQQWVQIRSLFHNKILSKLAHLTFPVEERTVTKQTRTVLETRLVDTNPHFRQLQDCIDWCKKKLDKLQEAEYGSDLGSVQRELEQCHKEAKNVEQFRGKYDSCVKAKSNFHGDELSLYNQYLSQLQKLYSDVTVKVSNRMSDLDSLYDFIKSATNELSWLNDKEDVEISRDWADRNLNCANIEQYYEKLMNELEKREIQFTAVQDRGEALVLQHHPASKCIEAHMSAIQAQWAWLLQLTLCLEVHLKHAIFHQAFYTDVKQAEKWLLERDELLNLEFSQSEFTLDEGEKLLQGMQILRDELNNFGDTVQNLIQQGQQVVPLKLRRQPVTRPLPVQSICNYKQSNVVIKKGELCTVLDNSGRIKWKVRNSQNGEANVPGVCFVIPPPDKEAIDAAERLRRQYDRTITLWQKKQLRMRQNMIFATIRVVKSWDLPQFLAIGSEQRNAIRKALNEDAEKLLAEGDPSDPQLRRLRREMDEVNRLFDELEKRARAEEESKNSSRIFNEQVTSLQSILEDAEKLLHQRVMSPIPRDLDTLHHLVLEHKEFESRLQILENDIEQIKDTFRNITLKTPNMKKSLEKILDKWNSLWSLSHLYTERLKSLEVIISGMEEAHIVLSEFEMKLASFEDLPTTESALELVHDKLQSLQSAVGQQQIAIDQLNDDYESSKQLIEKSRPMQRSTMSHTDVDRLAHDISKLNQRWNTICNHLSERIKCCELAYKHLKEYNKSKEEEDKWLDDTFAKLRNLTPVKEQLEASKSLLNSTMERVPKIEDVNISGGKLIREGKIFGSCLHKFRDWLLEIHPSLDASPTFNLRKRKLATNSQIPVDVISTELDRFNLRFKALCDQLVDFGRQQESDDSSTTKLIEQLESKSFRTFRTEFKILDLEKNAESNSSQIVTNGADNFIQNESTTDSAPIKKRYKIYENINTDSVIEMPGILHPCTGEVLTVGDAIALRILDVRTGKIVSSPDGTVISIDDAVKSNIIDVKLAEKLQGPCGLIDQATGRSISLLEAIQKELFSNNNSKSNDFEQVSISDAINSSCYSSKGIIDAHSTTQLVCTEIKLKSSLFCLTDCINQGLIDPSNGLFYDRNTGINYQIDIAVKNRLIEADRVREIVDFNTDMKITLLEALGRGIINAKLGKYMFGNHGEKLTFLEAKKRLLICKPMTLKEVCDKSLLVDDCNKIYSPLRNSKLNLLEAVSRGVLDSDSIKHVLSKKSHNLLTLNEALNEGIICLDMKYSDSQTGEICTFPEAVDRGYLISICEKSLFDIECFKIANNCHVSFNSALSMGLISKKNNGSIVIDPKSNSVVPFADLESRKLVKEDIFDFFGRKIGIFSEGVELTVLEAITNGFIDTKTGQILDQKSQQIVPINEAINRKIITSDGALLLQSLLNVNITVQNLSKTVKRYCTLSAIITKKDTLNTANNAFQYFDNSSLHKMQSTLSTLSNQNSVKYRTPNNLVLPSSGWHLLEAIEKNYLNPVSGLFLIPGTDRLVSFEECLKLNIINPSSAYVLDPLNNRKLSLISSVQKKLLNSLGFYNYKNNLINIRDAVDQGLIVLESNQLEDETMQLSLYEENEKGSFKEILISNKKLKSANIEVLQAKPSVLQKLRRRIIAIDDALRLKLINKETYDMLKSDNELDLSSGSIFDQQRMEFVNFREAIKRDIFHLNDRANISISLYRSLTIPEAIEQGLLDIHLNKILHPESGEILTLNEAIICNIIDPLSSIRIVSNQQVLSLEVAIEKRYINADDSTIGANLTLWEAFQHNLFVHNKKVAKSCPIPKAGMTFLVALNRGLIDLENREVQHPIKLNRKMSLKDALSNNFLMTLPYPQCDDSVLLEEVADLINVSNGTFFYNGTEMALKDAIDQGKLIVKPLNSFLVSSQESKTSTTLHTITTKVIELIPGYVLLNVNQVKCLESGEIISIDNAKKMGIVKKDQIKSEQFHDDSFDLNVNDANGVISLDEAVKNGLMNSNIAVVKDERLKSYLSYLEFLKNHKFDLNKKIKFVKKSNNLRIPLPTEIANNYTIYYQQPISFQKMLDLNYFDDLTKQVTFPTISESLTLKEALTFGLIDMDSALIADPVRKKCTNFNEAFRKGIVDLETACILDTSTSKYLPLSQAVKQRIILTPEMGFSLTELLNFGFYDRILKKFQNPFSEKCYLTFDECLNTSLIDLSLNSLQNKDTGDICSLRVAIEKGLLSKEDFLTLHEHGLIIATASRQAIEEKQKLCDEQLNKLLDWIGQIEQKLANQTVLSEDEAELRNQINNMKQIKDELFYRLTNVTHCTDQVRQLVLTGGDVLSKSEISDLEKRGRNLKTRFDQAVDRNERLLKWMYQSLEDLHKFRKELATFAAWLDKARRSLEDKEQLLSDLSRLNSNYENVKSFVSDVIAHQADLRFVTMSAQKFFDDSKGFLKAINEFRTSLPQRLSHIKPVLSHDSKLHSDVSYVTAQYKDLSARTNALSERMLGVGGRQKEYAEALNKAKKWLSDAEPRCLKTLSEPVAVEPKAIELQLTHAKNLANEFVNKGRLLDTARNSLETLLNSLNNQLLPNEAKNLETPVIDLINKYNQLKEALAEKCQDLDNALIQSQGVTDSLDNVVDWLNSSETQFRNLQKPASLIKDKLEEQIHEQKLYESELDLHHASIDSVAVNANEFIAVSSKSANSTKIAKQIQTKLKDLKSRYDKLLEKAASRREFLNDIYSLLCDFLKQSQTLTDNFKEIGDILQQKNADFKDVMLKKESLRNSFEDTVKKGKALLSKRDVTDISYVRDTVNLLESEWKMLNTNLDDKQKLIQQRSEQLSIYEKLRDQVLEWLLHMETTVSNFEPVAIQNEILQKQIDELKPILKEFNDYENTIRNVEEVGLIYDNLVKSQRSDSPLTNRASPFRASKKSPMSIHKIVISANSRSPSPYHSSISSNKSSDSFHLDDVSITQQQLSDIYNRYNLLGVRLNDRHNELENAKEEVRKCLDNLKTIRLFLDKIERQFPKDYVSVLSTKDEVDKIMKHAKTILEEIYEKQSLVDSTKTQIKDLLKRKPNSKGSNNLSEDLLEISNRWKNVHETCKDLIKMMENIKEFFDVFDSLDLWLVSKSRMMMVLGPISSDSRMVQSQVQQVQLLKEEFRVQQPQLQYLVTLGNDIINMCSNTKDSEKIHNKLSGIESRWKDLLKELDTRAASLGTAADTSREFDESLNRLKESLHVISDQLDDIVPSSKNPEDQLKKIESLERQLEGLRPLLADAEANGENLVDVLNDPTSKNEIQSKLAAVGKQYNNLQKKLDNKKAEVENLLRDGRQFQETCSKTFGWLTEELNSLSEKLLISANKDILLQQLENFEPVYRNVTIHEHEVIMLLNKGRDILSKKPDKQLHREIEKIQQNWDKLKRGVSERYTRLQTCMEHCKKYYVNQDRFMPWLRNTEDTLDAMKPNSFKRKSIEKQLKDLQQFRSEVWRKSGEYETSRMLGDTFLSSCDTDKAIVQNELADMKVRWEKLNNDLIRLLQIFEDILSKLIDFNEQTRDVSHQIHRFEDRFASLLNDSKDVKSLSQIEHLKSEIDTLQKPIKECEKLATVLIKEANNYNVDASHLTAEIQQITDRISDLYNKLNSRYDELKSTFSVVSQFNDKLKQILQRLSDLESQLDNMPTVARDLKSLRNQLDEMNVFVDKLANVAKNLSELTNSYNGLAPNFDNGLLKQQIESIQKQYQKIEQNTKHRQNDISQVIKRLEAFYAMYSNIMDDVKKADSKLSNLKATSTEIENIRTQQLDFKKLRKNIIEPLSKSVNECVKLGTNLIQTAPSDVSVSILEKDIEILQQNWNDLKEKLNERERKLDVGLLQFGKFQEALDGLHKWLTDIEEMVSNQKPPSADYKVVKAQLQEQKFLKKMLLDRQPSMSSLFSMANELSDDLNATDRKAIEKEIRDLRVRFNNLSENAQKRTLDLEQAMHVAKLFQEKLIPLEEWLNKIEKKIKDFQQVPTDEDRISAKIREHEVLHREILSKKAHFTELAETASSLMSLVGEEEAVALTDKLQEVSNRYTDLVDLSENIGVLLTNSRHGLRHLVLTYQDLVSWMEGIERNLVKYRFLAVFPDQLIEQTENLVQLTEDISARQPDVDSTVESGVELMKHITSDEALQLKDKLDNIQRKFNELIGRGVELLKRAQYILPIVQQFHDKHAIISDWMSEAESLVNGSDISENEIARLEVDIGEMRPILETVTTLGPQLCQNASNDSASMIESLVTKDNRRFDAIVERIQRKAERINLGKQRALEVVSDIDELLEWFREVEQQIREAEAPGCEPDVIRVQLKDHKALNDDISSQKGRVRDLLSTSKKMLRESSSMLISENAGLIREKMDDLRDLMESVSKLSQDRLSVLEQALPLSEHFHDTHNDLKIWLDEMEHQISMLSKPALKADIITQQQDRNELFLQTVAEHKPLIDKLNKTGEALLKLCNVDDGVKIQEILDCDNKRYNLLKLELKQRERELESALQESSQFSDKLEGMLRALSNTAEQVNNLEPISAHPPKIRDQINDNRALIDDLNKRKQAYDTVKRAASDVLNKTSNKSDPAIRDMNKKLSNLEKIWQEIEQATNDRSKSLEEALDAAQRFWKQLHSVMAVLKDLQNSIAAQEPPAADPKTIEKQQVALREIRHEIDQTKPEVDKVRASGKQLMSICGDADKPEVKKHIDDLDHAWDNVTVMFVKREENLIDAMEKAMEFYDVLQNLIKFLDVAEQNFSKMGPIGSDIDDVMKQIKQLQKFKMEVDPYMVQVEAINRQAHDLTERTSSDQAQAIKKPLSEVNRRWDSLLHDMIERQQQLENALLRLGQFQHALNELLVWIDKTHVTLNDLKPVLGDVKITEIEIAKLKVITNDIQAHENSVESLNIAGKQIVETGDDASEALDKLAELNKKWDNLLRNSDNKQRELEDALRDAQMFQAEIQDLVSWLNDVDGVITASKPVGGLPETANEQLERFMEVFNELEQTGPKIEAVLQQGQEYLRKSLASNTNLQQNLKNLKSKWDSVLARANDKKIKLEIALKEATEFHDSLQAFIDWLTSTEKVVTNFKTVSRVMETILLQIEDHKVLQKDVSVHRETMLNLDKKGSHLKYFSQKQDVILIKNLLISVQHRWERVVARVGERTRALDHGYKEAKDFYESWSHLINWLTDTEKTLDEINAEHDFGTNAVNIKSKLSKHQELQRALSSKQTSYDSVMKLGKQLKEKASKNDEPILKEMLQELKTKWTSVCSKCIERQRSLEEALLFSGQLSDAISALLSWLKSVEKELSTNKSVHGDLETVTILIEEHKAFEKELKARENQYESVTRTGHDMESKVNSSEFADTHQNLVTIETLWTSVCSLVDAKSRKLDDALRDAEELHKSVHMLLDWLSAAEQRLRFVNSLPDDETEASHLQNELDKFLFELDEKEHVKNETIELAQQILEKAHPNAVTIIKNWIKVIQTRWEEISSWAHQKEQKLQSHMKSLHDLDEILEELLKWLLNLENTLTALKKEPLPESVPLLESLIDDHREFMENTMKRQSEVNNICKSKQIKSFKESKKPSSRLRTPLRSSQLDLHRDISPQIGTGTLPRKQNKNETPINEYSCDPYPHIGPRFNTNAMDAEFKTPRVKLLWTRWKTVWVLAWERQRALYSKLEYLKEVERVKNFSWDEWRKRFLKFMNHKKSRLTDLFRKMDKDNNGLIPREDFIEGIIRTKFETSRLEMNAVADLFDRNNSGLIDWEEFIAALRPDWVERKDTDAEKIHDEVKRLVMLCTCRQKFKVFQVGEGKYRFGESQKLRLVRILRSTVMVRVGGGWVALDEFLIKNDPCRVVLVYPLPNPKKPEEHDVWCFFAEEFLKELMPIFEKVRANEELPCAYPIHVGSCTRFGAYCQNASSYHLIRERSQRSQPMNSYSGRTRSSASAGTPDSLSDNENGSFSKSWRKTPISNKVTPCGSRSNSRPNSRPPSRAGSKPPSRYGSANSLDSIDTPSRIPRKSSVPSVRGKNVTENGNNSNRRSSLTSPSSIPRSTIIKSIKKQTNMADTEPKISWKY